MEGLENGQTFKEAHQNAFSKAFDEKYGEGSYAVASAIAEKDSKGNSNLANLSIERTAVMLGTKINNLIKKGCMNEMEAKGAVSEMMQKSLQTYEQNGRN